MWVPPDGVIKETDLSPLPCYVSGGPSQKAERVYNSKKNPGWGSRDSSVSLTHLSQSPRSWIWSRHVLLSARDLTLGHWSPVGISLPQFLKGRRPAFPWIWGGTTENKNGSVVKIMWRMISYVSLAPWRSLDPPLLLWGKASFIQHGICWAPALRVCFPTLSKTVHNSLECCFL